MPSLEHPLALDSTKLEADLAARGHAVMTNVLDGQTCKAIADSYDDNTRFRSRIAMARYNFGQGEYQYFNYPLPSPVQTLREQFYEALAPIANHWHEQLGIESQWPLSLESLLQQCRAAGQQRPTPLLLKYQQGDYNCLHQDLYGEIHFPLQVIIQLSAPSVDFQGGELMLVEQRPRMQSKGTVVNWKQGDAVVIPVSERPRMGPRGFHRVKMRHGVSELLSGERFTLGLIFHDAK